MKHYNVSLTEDLVRVINPKGESTPSDVMDEIVPVIVISPIINKHIGVVKATTGTQTIFTTPTDKDFYLTSVHYSLLKDAVCDMSGYTQLKATTNDNLDQGLITFPVITLTAQFMNDTIVFPVPLKLTRGTTINFIGTFAAGVCVRTADITGYIRETTK